ncbi:MAG: choice-of-anchor J domain-containing protein, partial [Pontiellaceae bacterium]|nr:choice-of-anchor J domain-containing protein [Pontiellaceae bacterium]
SYAYYNELEMEFEIDKLTVEEAPPAVALDSPTEVTVEGMRLDWSAYAGDNFQSYKIYRHTAAGVNQTHELLATVTNALETSFVDSGLSARTRYYYKVYVSNTSDTTTPSNESSAETLGIPMGWSDGFEAGTAGAEWTMTGSWALREGDGVDGSVGLTDSAGDYEPNSDTWAQIAVDLSTAEWPILVFKDRYALPISGDNAYVQIGAADNNNIASIAWTTVYSLREARSEWAEQQIDLSHWKGLHTVYIRFRLSSDGSIQDDGWAIDDISVREHEVLPAVTGLYDRFENGLTNWINGGWACTTNAAWQGGMSVLDHESKNVMAYSDSWLVYGRELDLSTESTPKITFWTRGWRGYKDRAQFSVRLSKDGGSSWVDVSGTIAVSQDWTRFQYDVPADYCTNGIRVAIRSYAYYSDLESAFFLDAVGVGGVVPGAPVAVSPLAGATVSDLLPVLTVQNSDDYQSDPLTYRFEVYSDAALGAEALVAQIPLIASGELQTEWAVDSQLQDGNQYWWRCRSMDDSGNESEWSSVEAFHVIQQNAAPNAPQIIAPYADSNLPSEDGYFIWFAAVDPDGSDVITGYQVQIAADEDFSDVLLDASTSASSSVEILPINALEGYGALTMNTRYHWRIRAFDNWDAASEWAEESFVYGVLSSGGTTYESVPVRITGTELNDSGLTLIWAEQTRPVHVEFTSDLVNPNWTTVPSATGITTNRFTVEPDASQGFFRVLTE